MKLVIIIINNLHFMPSIRDFFAIDNFDDLAPIPDRPYSLFEGMAGLVTLLLDLQDPENAMFPCFEF